MKTKKLIINASGNITGYNLEDISMFEIRGNIIKIVFKGGYEYNAVVTGEPLLQGILNTLIENDGWPKSNAKQTSKKKDIKRYIASPTESIERPPGHPSDHYS